MDHTSKKQMIIVKIGTNVLTRIGEGEDTLDIATFASIGEQVRQLSMRGYGVIIVSSGAITAGVLSEQKCRDDICSIVEEQRYAARGWDLVVQEWKAAIGARHVSSTLLTKREVTTTATRDKLLGVIECCLDHGDIFIVNENDCLSDDEIRFGDNDMLAATLATECQLSGIFASVQLVLLTNTDGLNLIPADNSTIIRHVSNAAHVERYASGASNGHSRGGMRTKVQAAKLATTHGVSTYIANGRNTDAIQRAISGDIGTSFTAQAG